jgi:hypothetical protein
MRGTLEVRRRRGRGMALRLSGVLERRGRVAPEEEIRVRHRSMPCGERSRVWGHPRLSAGQQLIRELVGGLKLSSGDAVQQGT